MSVLAGLAVMVLLVCLGVTDNDRKDYTFSLNEILHSDTHLAFYTVHQYVDVYLDGYCIGATFVCLAQLLLQFFGVPDLRNSLFVTHIVIAVGAVGAIGIAAFERIKYPQKSKMLV